MRDLVYYVAVTADGFIAGEDGAFDGFPLDDEYLAALYAQLPETFAIPLRAGEDPLQPNRYFDTVLMGRNTYEVGLPHGVTSPYPTLKQYVFSRTIEKTASDDVELVRADAVETARALKASDGMAIWICGGAELAGALYAAGLIDELILKVNPVLFGRGIPLLRGDAKLTNLKLSSSTTYRSGHAILRYRVSS
jgi:dihydrofolate reductase